jgi:hypothetical protein
LPPLSFPKGGPPRGVVGSLDRRTPLHAPFEWRVPVPGHARRRLPVRASPRGSLGMVAIGHPPTDHKCCARRPKPAGLLLPVRALPAVPHCVGLPAVKRARRMSSPRTDALTRVNIACRCQGNEEGWHDTRPIPGPPTAFLGVGGCTESSAEKANRPFS